MSDLCQWDFRQDSRLPETSQTIMNNSHCSLIRETFVQFAYYTVPHELLVTERWCSGMDWDSVISAGDKLRGNEPFFSVCSVGADLDYWRSAGRLRSRICWPPGRLQLAASIRCDPTLFCILQTQSERWAEWRKIWWSVGRHFAKKKKRQAQRRIFRVRWNLWVPF